MLQLLLLLLLSVSDDIKVWPEMSLANAANLVFRDPKMVQSWGF